MGDIVPEFCTLCGEEIICPTCENPTDGGQYLEAPDDVATENEHGEQGQLG